ncbi:hypothetical protein [Kitasatospora sp. NPDC017646]|uniref:hypothetical protein n=1 Tax=Kitasatospora sp. NPDC017646 TaxID=3364024 RepID=UPI0037B11BAE
MSRAALLLSAALLDAATTEGLGEPADGTALLDLPLTAVSALLRGTYDETITEMLDRTRPALAVTEPLLDELRELWGPRAGVEEIHQRGRVQRLAFTIAVGHQVAGQRRNVDPVEDLARRELVRLRDRLDDLAPWVQEQRAAAWAEEIAAQLGGDAL